MRGRSGILKQIIRTGMGRSEAVERNWKLFIMLVNWDNMDGLM